MTFPLYICYNRVYVSKKMPYRGSSRNLPQQTPLKDCDSDVCSEQEKYNNHCDELRKKKTHRSKKNIDPDEFSLRRQKLELMLSRTQIQEAHSTEKHNELQARFDRAEALLDSLLHYIDCVKLELTSSHRLCLQLNSFIVNDRSVLVTENLSRLLKNLCAASRFDEVSTKNKIYTVLDSGRDLEPLFDEYASRKRDFSTGILNFKILLENLNLSVRELDKLQLQFDDVLLSYQHSRCMLDQELPHAVAKRLDVLQESLEKLAGDLDLVAGNRPDLATLLRTVSESMKASGRALEVRHAVTGNEDGK